MCWGSLSCIVRYIWNLCKKQHWVSHLITTSGSLIWASLYKHKEKQDQTGNPGYEPPSQYQAKSSDFMLTVTICTLLSPPQHCHSQFYWLELSCEWMWHIFMHGACIHFIMNHGNSCQVMIGLLNGSYCNSTVQVNIPVMCVCYGGVITLPPAVLSQKPLTWQ